MTIKGLTKFFCIRTLIISKKSIPYFFTQHFSIVNTNILHINKLHFYYYT